VPTGPRQPQRRVYEGVEYLSVQAAAEVLGRSVRTLRRLEKANVIARPRHELPCSRPGMRWYSAQDLEELRRLVEESGYGERQPGGRKRLKTLLDDLPGLPREPSRNPLWAGEDMSPRPRQFLRRRDQDFETEWLPPSERRMQEWHQEPIPPPVCCPSCGVEVTWIMQPVPGAADIQAPWCERCGSVSLEEPDPPDPNLCPSCQSTVTWEIGDARGGFVPTCPVHGTVEMPKPKVDPREERAFQHRVHFGGLPPAPQRPRGLTQRDVIGPVRMSRRQPPGPKLVFIDPHAGPTRPGR
jgi:hypothetical protein